MWDDIGKLQFDFMLRMGLKPHDRFLDVACGSLRGGVHFIPYLDEGHYMGIDKERELIDTGIEQELGPTLQRLKKPQFVTSTSFEFEKFSTSANYALAQSLFTHLPRPMIEECLRKLRAWIEPEGAFYATFFESAEDRTNPSGPHDHGYFAYTREQMATMGTSEGWEPTYIGDWRHPRHQVMMQYRPK